MSKPWNLLVYSAVNPVPPTQRVIAKLFQHKNIRVKVEAIPSAQIRLFHCQLTFTYTLNKMHIFHYTPHLSKMLIGTKPTTSTFTKQL